MSVRVPGWQRGVNRGSKFVHLDDELRDSSLITHLSSPLRVPDAPPPEQLVCLPPPSPQPSTLLTQLMDAAGGSSVATTIAKRALEMVEAGLPDERPVGMPSSSLMGFPHVQSSLNALRRTEVWY